MCTSNAIQVMNSKSVHVYGASACSWQCLGPGTKESMVSVRNSTQVSFVGMYASCVKGTSHACYFLGARPGDKRFGMGATHVVAAQWASVKSDDDSAASSFDASFEGGNLDFNASRWTGPNEISYLGARKCGPASTQCSPYTNWAFFSVSNLSTAQPTTLVTLSSEWRSPPWFSYVNCDDGSCWTRINTTAPAPAHEGHAHVHRFTYAKAFVAFSIPYTPNVQGKRLLADLPPAFKRFSLATSEAGNDVAAINISDGGARCPQKKRALVWFQARQHAWESGASWLADGVARFAAGGGGAALRAIADVVVVPVMDVDNVLVGGAGKDQLPVDFNRDWGPAARICRNETQTLCQHWKAIKAVVRAIDAAMSSGVYDALIFVDSHSPGDPTDPAQVWTECSHGPSAVSAHAWNVTQGYKSAMLGRAKSCGRLAYKNWCAEVGPAYGNQYSGYHADEISFMYVFQKYKALMNSATQRSMSFSHETSAATVAEAHCYGAAIGASLAAVLDRTKPIDTAGASTKCTGYPDSCHELPPPPSPVLHEAGFVVSGAGKSDVNGKYVFKTSPKGWEHSAYYVKDANHQLYRYKDAKTGRDQWHLCHVGKCCWYDAPGQGQAEPPASGWKLAPNAPPGTQGPAPTLTASKPPLKTDDMKSFPDAGRAINGTPDDDSSAVPPRGVPTLDEIAGRWMNTSELGLASGIYRSMSSRWPRARRDGFHIKFSAAPTPAMFRSKLRSAWCLKVPACCFAHGCSSTKRLRRHGRSSSELG